MSVSEATVRLYVGGLPGDITRKQLEGRFASFGTVSNTKLIVSKQQSTSPGCRGFAYVDFSPKDDQSLHRCLSLVRSWHTVSTRTLILESAVSQQQSMQQT
jgi:hypothetical protein